MSNLFSSINTTVKALAAHSRAIETTGKNLANVNNPAYARQRVIYGDRGTVVTQQGVESLGLEALGIEQMRDLLLDQQVVREISLKSSLEAEQSGYQRAQAGLGQSIDRAGAAGQASSASASGIAAAIDDFFNAFQSFAASPTDSGERGSLLQKAGILTDRFQLADTRLAQVQTDLDAEIGDDVAEINRLLDSIAELNTQIGRFELTSPGSAVDLRDQRQTRIELLATKLPIETRPGTGGQIQVVAKDGAGADVVLINLNSVQGTVTFTGTQLTGGSPATALALTGGSVHGALQARDGAIQTLRNDIDNLAQQFVTSINAVYNPTGSTGNFFVSSGTTAATISVNSAITSTTLKASDGGPAGDNTIALAVAQLATTAFSTTGGDQIDGTFSSFFGQSVSRIGQALATTNARVEDQTNIEKLVRSQRDSVSGVSLDEEMADLMKYQRSFQASSRVFSVLDGLLANVVNEMGRA